MKWRISSILPLIPLRLNWIHFNVVVAGLMAHDVAGNTMDAIERIPGTGTHDVAGNITEPIVHDVAKHVSDTTRP